MKTWLITDTHFNHTNMVQLCGRPENFNDVIIKHWKHLVADDDLVIHLGDVIFSRAGELTGIMAQLPGKKVLTLGNHDNRKPEWYMNRGFHFAADRFDYKKIAFSHIPLTREGLGKDLSYLSDVPHHRGVSLNIHGHFHNTDHRDWEYEVGDHNRLLVLENEDYKPVLLEEFLSRA